MSCVPLEPPKAFEPGPRQYLEKFIHLMSSLRGGQERYLPMLIEKIHETLPVMVTPDISRGLPSSTMMEGNMHMDHLNPIDNSEQPATGLKSEVSSLSGTPPFGSQYADDEDSEMDLVSPYSIATQSSYSG